MISLICWLYGQFSFCYFCSLPSVVRDLEMFTEVVAGDGAVSFPWCMKCSFWLG